MEKAKKRGTLNAEANLKQHLDFSLELVFFHKGESKSPTKRPMCCKGYLCLKNCPTFKHRISSFMLSVKMEENFPTCVLETVMRFLICI